MPAWRRPTSSAAYDLASSQRLPVGNPFLKKQDLLVQCPRSGSYSYRSAVSGSTVVARRAGRAVGIDGSTSDPPETSSPKVCSFQLPKMCSFRLPLTLVEESSNAVN